MIIQSDSFRLIIRRFRFAAGDHKFFSWNTIEINHGKFVRAETFGPVRFGVYFSHHFTYGKGGGVSFGGSFPASSRRRVFQRRLRFPFPGQASGRRVGACQLRPPASPCSDRIRPPLRATVALAVPCDPIQGDSTVSLAPCGAPRFCRFFLRRSADSRRILPGSSCTT